MPDWTDEIRRRLPEPPADSPEATAVLRELADHLQDMYDAQRAAGASEEEARRTALAELGDRERLAATWRDVRRPEAAEPVPVGARGRGNPIGDVWRDVRYGARLLWRNPGFTAIAVLTLALGIGANTTVFTVINTILLNPLPVAGGSELVSIHTLDRKSAGGGAGSSAGSGGPSSGSGSGDASDRAGSSGAGSSGAESGGASSGTLLPISYLNLKDLQSQNDVFSSLAGYSSTMALTSLNGSTPERIFAELVTANYFDTLGVRPALGRFFLPEEDRTPGSHPVLVIGYATWQQRFGGASDTIGRTLRINRVVFTIVGVAPEGFKGLDGVFGPDVWMPSMMNEQVAPAQARDRLRDRGDAAFYTAARLKPGATVAQAGAAMQALATSLARDYPEANRHRTLTVQPLTRATIVSQGGPGPIIGSALLMAIVGLILVIACSNVANLLLARSAARRSEIALRLALGAGRARVMRQLLTESVLLGLISGVVGIVVAYAGTQLLWSFRPPEVAKNLIDPAIDLRVLVFGLIVSVLTGLIFGAAPAWQSSRPNLVDALKEEARTAGRTRRRVSLGRALLVGQVALSLVSLVTAGLCLRAVQRAHQIDPGFETQRLGVVMMSPGQAGYDQPRSEQFYRDARARIAQIPGVTAVSWATSLPLWSGSLSRSIFIDGQDQPDPTRGIPTVVNRVDPDYFAASGVRVLRGREFTDADRAGALPVAMINETLAERYWPNQDPIGRRIRFEEESVYRTIVGVARTANYGDLGESPQPCVYLPLRQNFSDAVVLYVRTAADPAPVLAMVQREIRTLDNQIDVADVRTIQKVISQALFGATMGVGLLGVFGLLGLGLASLGLYGVMAYAVNLRQRELGVRMALGAGQSSVLRLVLGEGLSLVVVGLVVGFGASLLMGGALSKMLYGVSAFDPLSFLGAALVLLAAAALACYLPARRASRMDPLVALREG